MPNRHIERPGFKQLDWEAAEFSLVKPDSFPTFYPNIVTSPRLVEEVRTIGGRHLVRAIGYGSSFNHRESHKSGRMDLMFVVDDALEFHQQNIAGPYLQYGTTKNPNFHAFLNGFGLNYLPGEIELEDGPQKIKAVVIGIQDFVQHLNWGNDRGLITQDSFRYSYLNGRLQKALLVTLWSSDDPVKQRQIDLAINQNRIHNVSMTLALLPQRFSPRQLLELYTQLSYLADVRVEKSNKYLTILNGSLAETEQMLYPIIGQFVQAGLLKQDGDNLVKMASLPQWRAWEWLAGAKAVHLATNYGKNWLTFGLLEGPEYCLDKIARTVDASLADNVPGLFASMSEQERLRLVKGVVLGVAAAAFIGGAVAIRRAKGNKSPSFI
ncbi:hypothetical protein HYW43_02255 [Candidatus Daviesbacteria bacterium]|nr:hypothetical protein [Candidatus Daviesbacteria bacterium]